MAKSIHVSPHKRRINGRWHDVDHYDRTARPEAKKRIIAKKPMKGLYTVRNENGEFLGYKFKQQ